MATVSSKSGSEDWQWFGEAGLKGVTALVMKETSVMVMAVMAAILLVYIVNWVMMEAVLEVVEPTTKEVSEVKYRSKRITQNATQDIRKWKI